MSKTALFSSLRRAFLLARQANRTDASAAEAADRAASALSRRQFLKGSAAAGAAVVAASSLGCPARLRAGRVAIVGGGIAGLNAAQTLRRHGIHASIYEASTRTGGRIWTAHDLMGPGFHTELGGEFIDSIHEDMLALAERFDLELLDTQSASETALIKDAFYFNDTHFSEEEVIAAFQPLAAQMEADLEAAGDFDYTEANDFAVQLDNTPLSEYLDDIGATGMIRELLDVAYVTEYGLDSSQQSPFNLLFLIGTDTSEGFEVFGESDERFKIKGGNQQIVDHLARRLEDRIHLEHRLEAVAHNGRDYVLSFAGPNGSPVEVKADHVILALPFTLLREVDIQVELPEVKRKAIEELGYGTNAKLMFGVDERVWREQGYVGSAFTDESLQLCWDNTQLQPGNGGGITLYSGGTPGVTVGQGTPAEQVALKLPGLEKVFPGITEAALDNATRFHWPTYEFTKGSYACYKPGQWTEISGVEFEPVDNLYFAGEHCSIDFQGYMNGGAETGRRAAELLLETVRGRRPRLAPPRFKSRRLRVHSA